MLRTTVYCAGTTPAMTYARNFLQKAGVSLSPVPQWDIGHLLLDVPTFRPGGITEERLHTLLSSLPGDIRIWGGNLNHPALEGYRTIDFLKEEAYLRENAAITASCTISILDERRKDPWSAFPTLIIGWGRIGKSLASLLKKRGCPVTIATGNREKHTEIISCGYCAADVEQLTSVLPPFRCIVNTAPAPVLSQTQCDLCPFSLKVDLASRKGIDSSDVLWARGLPGKLAPEQSGQLIASTFLRLWKEDTP